MSRPTGRKYTPAPAWTPAPAKAKPKKRKPAVCGKCLVGDCDMCVRAGCHHPHGTDVRKVGVAVPVAGYNHHPDGGWR